MARGRASKATKKFESKHLSKVLENRKIQKRNKDKYSKNKVRNDARTTAAKAIVQDELAQKKAVANGKGSIFDGMTMDEFLETGGGTAGKEVHELEASHRAGLEGLKEKDPSFYEFLKKNDRELLEFDPDDMEEEMDVEEEEEEGDKATLEGGLTQEVLAKWENLLVEEKSLGTLKKVLIAVRSAAANVTGGEESSQTGNAKYILTDPEGSLAPSQITDLSLRSIAITSVCPDPYPSPTPCSSNREEWQASSSLTQ
jgi:nucleolar complex protein 2